VIRNASAPYGVSLPGAPNLSTTRWRVVADQKSLRFYGESATSPNVFWVDLKKLDFSEGAHVRKLDLGVDMSHVLAGEASNQFVPAKPFDFMEAE
jgi:choloylglycine hydrolase